MEAFPKIIIIITFLAVVMLGLVPQALTMAGEPYGWGPDLLAQLMGVPRDAIEWPQVFWVLVLPYISTLAIIYGLFEEIGIFRRAAGKDVVYIVIAGAWSALLIPTGILGVIASFIYGVGALIGIIIFVGLFIAGSIAYAIVRGKSYGYSRGGFDARESEFHKKEEEIRKIRKKRDGLNKQIADLTDKMTKNKISPEDYTAAVAELKVIRNEEEEKLRALGAT